MSYVKLSDYLYFGIHPMIVKPTFHIDYYIDLTESDEMPKFICPEYASSFNFPIKDRKSVSLKEMKEIVKHIISLEGVVYIFCKGGHGRSGMIASAVYGSINNISGEKAMEHINKEWHSQRDMTKLKPIVRKLGSPQTLCQKQIVKQFLDDKVNIILFYDENLPYFQFSNFYKLKNGVTIDDERFRDTEQYFQVMKFRGPYATLRMIEYSNIIREADSPMKVKLLGTQKKSFGYGSKWKLNKNDDRLINNLVDEYKDVTIRSDWNVESIVTMVIAVYNKFTQYPELKKIITSLPDNSYIVEHTTRDKIWADGGDGGSGKVGKNRLGKILTVLSHILKYGNCNKISLKLKKLVRIFN